MPQRDILYIIAPATATKPIPFAKPTAQCPACFETLPALFPIPLAKSATYRLSNTLILIKKAISEIFLKSFSSFKEI